VRILSRRTFVVTALLVMVCGLSGVILAQLNDTIDRDLSAMNSGVQSARMHAFYSLLQPEKHAKPFRASAAFTELLGRKPAKNDALKMAVITTLGLENEVVRRANRENGTLTEEYSNYYGDLIAAVSSLAIHAQSVH
jgi:hypothetical protein